MSYILDALRRLEQDKERAKKGANPMEAVLVPDIEGEQRPARSRLWWTGAGVVLLVTVITATYWVTRRTLDVPVKKAAEGMTPHLASAPLGSNRAVPASAPEAVSSFLPPPRATPEPAVPAPKRAEASLSGLPLSSPLPPGKPGEEAGSSSLPLRLETEDRSPASVARGVVSSPRKGAPAALPDAAEDERVEAWRGSELKINAIAYSRDRKRRFAVVNLKTVREGDQVEGLSVVTIQENGVVFEKEGRKYRVVLSTR